ncbi:JAB domain-containing protein [Pedobacter gandavensis]|uniref:JAB domain-containing protein n=1 Tax=Pedobacter gandavensis TaxID=2679963 RepID=UPI002478762F|nr:JAB domain-containing protein [Pedobacter gandavensis]WGQ09918.1 JAB domain-containing protein [Pedobacter gandavensis]
METLKIQNDLSKIAEIKISYLPKFKAYERPQITSSMDGYKALYNCWDKNTIALREEFKILLLNYNNRVLGCFNVGTGGVSAVVVDAKLIFGVALKASASAIILAHCHPSGNLDPSSQDITITNKLIEIGKYLDLRILDHLILTPDNGYFSFADDGLI